jgi:RNA polymerase sigma-70 factor (ECF subfamily)
MAGVCSPEAVGVGGTAPLDRLHAAVGAALAQGDVTEARRRIAAARQEAPSGYAGEEWSLLCREESWSDEWLIAAVCCETPDEAALDALVGRYWATLFARCRVLTAEPDEAMDLAQEVWYRVLRARRGLRPDGNFPAYLSTVATNVWRDSHRRARRAGPLAERRLASLDVAIESEDGECLSLSHVVPDLGSLSAEEQLLLRMDVDEALGRLSPRTRDVLVSRFLDGASSAEIGLRYGRTEQTITAWVRQGVRELQVHLGESRGGAVRQEER